MKKRFFTLEDFDFHNKKVILRTDFNVPIVKGKITDESRISRSMTSIRYLMEKGAKIIVLSHFARPKGKFNADMTLSPIVDCVSNHLHGKKIEFAFDILSHKAQEKVAALQPGDILIAENIRFHPEEESNSRNFAAAIAKLGDYYVNDAFSCSHRAHASIDAITDFLPSSAGLLHQEELESLESIISRDNKILAITGGAKVSTKINLLHNLIAKANDVMIGGAMANTFLKAKGLKIGKSIYEEELVQTAKDIMEKAKQQNCNIILPDDVVTSNKLEHNYTNCRVVPANYVKNNEMILDIGPESVSELVAKIKNSDIVIWNGPLGAFEISPYDNGTTNVARIIAKLTFNKEIVSVAGGGDVVSAIHQSGLENSFTYISTGGGAFLEWLAGESMPGIIALERNYAKRHSNN